MFKHNALAYSEHYSSRISHITQMSIWLTERFLPVGLISTNFQNQEQTGLKQKRITKLCKNKLQRRAVIYLSC